MGGAEAFVAMLDCEPRRSSTKCSPVHAGCRDNKGIREGMTGCLHAAQLGDWLMTMIRSSGEARLLERARLDDRSAGSYRLWWLRMSCLYKFCVCRGAGCVMVG
jgi:hypothetical protein